MSDAGTRRARRLVRFLLAAVVACFAPAAAQAVNYPFGSHPMPYASGTILPDHVSQATLDQAVRDAWDAWKATYLEPACGPGRWVVLSATRSGNLTVSEAHGYGMMLAALMAGHDPEAHAIFDGMYAYFRDHPSVLTPNLMAWYQTRSCASTQGGDSASDGDLDIAFALLLADRQWGSCGAVDYAAAAQQVLADVRAATVDASGQYVLLGDWADPSSGAFHTATRSSDWMPDHYRAFAAATGDPAWSSLGAATWDLVDAMQATHAPATGLLPDFVRDPLGSPVPAESFFLEGPNDGAYDYNACRVPWRLGTDFLVSGEPRAKAAVERIADWIQTATGGDPSAIRSGYRLDGTPSPDSDYLSLAFAAPLGVGAMVDASNQAWLNDLWDLTAGTPLADGGYYENTLRLLSMLVMSGNWWSPEQVAPGACDPGGTPRCTAGATVFDGRVDLAGLGLGPARQTLKLSGALMFPDGRPAAFPLDGGAQLVVDDLGAGATAIFDLSEDTSPVPPASTAGCQPTRDGWKVAATKVLYRNGSGALDPPACTPGSAQGLAKLQYRLDSARDLRVQAQAKRTTLASPVGPLRLTVVLGPSADAGAAGACGVSPALTCTGAAAKRRCE